MGAGGSFEVGLPIGDQLKHHIARNVLIEFNQFNQTAGATQIVEAIQELLRPNNLKEADQYFNAGCQLAESMPQAISIDNFLHYHADNKHIVTIGKIGIAKSILDAERRSTIFQARPGKFDFTRIKDTWHTVFFKLLLEGVQKKDIESIFENVTFITFNYDRCIEHYLSNALATYAMMPLDEAYEITNRLNIIHPYGQIGLLPWQAGNPSVGVSYGHEPTANSLLAIYPQLQTFTEGAVDDEMLDQIRNSILAARRVVYLGFSFGEMNMELMSVDHPGVPKEVFGTTMGISRSNLELIQEAIQQSLHHTQTPNIIKRFELDPSTCNELLLNHWKRLTS